MFSPRLRLLFIPLFFIAGIAILVLQLNFLSGIALLVAASILLLGHFRHGAMPAVLSHLRKGDIPAAQNSIQLIKRPEWLSKRFQAYYYFALSLIATYSQDADAAEQNAAKSIQIGGLPESEQSILYYNLARATYEKKNFTKATEYLSKLKALSIDDLHLKQRVEELEKALKTG
jgi:hypothetical protein